MPHHHSCQRSVSSRFCVLCFFEKLCEVLLCATLLHYPVKNSFITFKYIKYVHLLNKVTLTEQTVVLQELIQNIQMISPCLKPELQHDAHEFFRFLIDTMQECCGESKFMYPFAAFAARLNTYIDCSCGHIFERVDPVEELCLELPNQSSSVEDLMTCFTMTEQLNSYCCGICKTNQIASCRMALLDLPHVLVLQLKRFTFNQTSQHTCKVCLFEFT
jgi:uncharacterized UBP type Zn finger protein